MFLLPTIFPSRPGYISASNVTANEREIHFRKKYRQKKLHTTNREEENSQQETGKKNQHCRWLRLNQESSNKSVYPRAHKRHWQRERFGFESHVIKSWKDSSLQSFSLKDQDLYSLILDKDSSVGKCWFLGQQSRNFSPKGT